MPSQPPGRKGWAQREGSPLPLGATWIAAEESYNFALYSKHAERVVLLAYRAEDLVNPAVSVELDHLHHKSGRIWHCRVTKDALRGARYYAYSVAGPPPSGRDEWHAFDADKVLLDPYAHAVYFPPAFDRMASMVRGSNASRAPLGVIPPAVADNGAVVTNGVRRHEADAVVYELHVRNFTRHASSGVTEKNRGTFAGVIEKIPYLTELGVTVVELLPVFQYDPGAPDRWGYMPLNFFALHDGYLAASDADGGHAEFRAMIAALHAAGIEVVLDVVYNHTCEGGQGGPAYSFKGIDNSTYYLMTGDATTPYADYAATGNTLNSANHAVRKMIMDSMRHWVRLGVDGFRFDLASIYSRDVTGALQYHEPPIFGEIAADPDFADVRLIAEPWDAQAFQLGRGFPASGWQQWNGAFRDDVRRFVRGDAGMVPAMMRRLYGSDDLFPDERLLAYRPSQSVNYVTCHDGPTLYDLVSYSHKHNWTNGHGNLDGPRESYAWNCGWEGDQALPDEVEALRLRQARNFVALVVLANGTPMLRAGDEFLRTQRGNDNPYNHDDEITWLDWTRSERYAGHLRFVKQAIAFRKAHPSLSRSRFWRSDVSWYGTSGAVDFGPASSCFAFCLHGAAEEDADIYAMINASREAVTFVVREGMAQEWRRVIDTSLPGPDDILAAGEEAAVPSSDYVVGPHSVVVLVRARQTSPVT